MLRLVGVAARAAAASTILRSALLPATARAVIPQQIGGTTYSTTCEENQKAKALSQIGHGIRLSGPVLPTLVQRQPPSAPRKTAVSYSTHHSKDWLEVWVISHFCG